MKTAFSIVAMLFSIIASTCFAADTVPVMKGASAFFAQEPAVATGVSIERALVPVLTAAQLDQILKHNEGIPLNTTTKIVGWDFSHTHVMYETKATKYAVLDGSVIKAVEKTTEATKLMFNPFFAFVGAYLILLWGAYWITPKSLVSKVAVAVSIFFAATAIVTVVVSTVIQAALLAGSDATVGVGVASIMAIIAVVVTFSGALTGRENARNAAIVGSVAMLTAAGLMLFI